MKLRRRCKVIWRRREWRGYCALQAAKTHWIRSISSRRQRTWPQWKKEKMNCYLSEHFSPYRLHWIFFFSQSLLFVLLNHYCSKCQTDLRLLSFNLGVHYVCVCNMDWHWNISGEINSFWTPEWREQNTSGNPNGVRQQMEAKDKKSICAENSKNVPRNQWVAN